MPGMEVIFIQRIVWLVLMLLFVVGEAATVGLTSIWFAAGSLAALIVALLGGGIIPQIVVFSAVSLLCLLVVRPLAARYVNSKVEPTNADRIIGTEAIVTETINNVNGTGAITVGGITWTARSGSETVIPAGARVRVGRIEGVKAFVEEIKEEVKC